MMFLTKSHFEKKSTYFFCGLNLFVRWGWGVLTLHSASGDDIPCYYGSHNLHLCKLVLAFPSKRTLPNLRVAFWEAPKAKKAKCISPYSSDELILQSAGRKGLLYNRPYRRGCLLKSASVETGEGYKLSLTNTLVNKLSKKSEVFFFDVKSPNCILSKATTSSLCHLYP
jgi:hypothetical protein